MTTISYFSVVVCYYKVPVAFCYFSHISAHSSCSDCGCSSSDSTSGHCLVSKDWVFIYYGKETASDPLTPLPFSYIVLARHKIYKGSDGSVPQIQDWISTTMQFLWQNCPHFYYLFLMIFFFGNHLQSSLKTPFPFCSSYMLSGPHRVQGI